MPNRIARLIIITFLASGMFAPSAFSGEVYSPARGQPIRKELLDTIRPRVEAEMRTSVQFVVHTINIQQDWAFIAATPQHRDGSAIAIASTKFAADADFLDGLTTYSLLKFQNNRWNEITFVTGPTDVAHAAWPQEYGCPRAVVGLE